MKTTVRGIPQSIADEVRRTRVSPGYGHPAVLETAQGTGPCRCCLRSLPLAFESRASGSRVLELACNAGTLPEAEIGRLFGDPAAEWLHLRHAEAGCFIARVDRVAAA